MQQFPVYLSRRLYLGHTISSVLSYPKSSISIPSLEWHQVSHPHKNIYIFRLLHRSGNGSHSINLICLNFCVNGVSERSCPEPFISSDVFHRLLCNYSAEFRKSALLPTSVVPTTVDSRYKLPGPDYFAYVFVFLDSVICRLYTLTLSDQAHVTLQLRVILI